MTPGSQPTDIRFRVGDRVVDRVTGERGTVAEVGVNVRIDFDRFPGWKFFRVREEVQHGV